MYNWVTASDVSSSVSQLCPTDMYSNALVGKLGSINHVLGRRNLTLCVKVMIVRTWFELPWHTKVNYVTFWNNDVNTKFRACFNVTERVCWLVLFHQHRRHTAIPVCPDCSHNLHSLQLRTADGRAHTQPWRFVRSMVVLCIAHIFFRLTPVFVQCFRLHLGFFTSRFFTSQVSACE